MKTKLFSILTLLLCVCSGAWAQDPTLPTNATPTGVLDILTGDANVSTVFSGTSNGKKYLTYTLGTTIRTDVVKNGKANWAKGPATDGGSSVSSITFADGVTDAEKYGFNTSSLNKWGIHSSRYCGFRVVNCVEAAVSTKSNGDKEGKTLQIQVYIKNGDAWDYVETIGASTYNKSNAYVLTTSALNTSEEYVILLTSAYTSGSDAYEIRFAASSAPVDPTITFNNGSYNVGDDALDLSSLFTSNSSGAVTYSITDAGTTGATIGVDGKSFTATAAGTATVQASQASATGFNAKTATATITVTNLTTPTFTVTSTADYVIGNFLSLSSLITANNSDGAVSYTVKDAGTTGASISEGVFTATTAGTAIVTIAVAASATYAAASQDVTITVATNPLGTHTVTFALSGSSASGSATSVKLGSFSSSFTANNLTISGTKSGYSGAIAGTNNETEYDDTKYVDIAFTVADGYTFAPTAVSFKANPLNATSNMKYKLALIDENNNILSNDIACAKNTDNAVTFASGAFTSKLLSGTVHIRAYFYGAASDKTVYILSPITVTGTVAVARVVSNTDIALTDVKVNGSSITSAQLTTLKTADAYTLTMEELYNTQPTVTFEKTTTTTYTEGDPDVAVVDVPATMNADDDYYIATATIDDIEYTVKLPINKTPHLEADVTKIEVVSVGPATGTATIKLTGAYLTGDAAVAFASSVEGLAISPATITVTDGTVDQEFTVSYQSDAAVGETDVNLTFTVGAKSVVIPVTYSSTAAVTTIFDVTGIKTWNFKTAATSDVASPASARLIPLANATGFDEEFDYESLAGKAQYFFYKSYPSFQGSQLKFHTTVPGTVTVTFSNTGGSRPYRYLYVNGEATTYKSNATAEVTTDPIAVEAGDVVLSGYIPNASDPTSRAGDVVGEAMLRFYSVVFTPTVDVEVAATGFSTFVPTAYNLDFSDTDITAYVIKANNENSVTLEEKAVVAQNEPVLLHKASGGTVSVPAVASATAGEGNLLVAGTGASVTYSETGHYYVLATVNGVTGFYRANNNPVAVGKAYLDAGENAGAHFFALDLDGETTGITTVEEQKSLLDGDFYNIAGQRVAQPARGLYIVNGKKVVIK